MDGREDRRARKLAALIHAASLTGAYRALAKAGGFGSGGFAKLADRHYERTMILAREILGEETPGAASPPRLVRQARAL